MTIQLSDHFDYKRLLSFVFPSVIMVVFISIYSVVDGLFISNYVGKTAFAAVNLIMPINSIFGGVGFMLGTGGSALVAKTLGEQKKERANQYFRMILYVTILIGVVLSAIGILGMRPLSIWLGADEDMLWDCMTYGKIMMAFLIPFMLQNAFQSFLVTAERPGLGLISTVVAGVSNMVLDFLLVAVFPLGVAGAALASGLSQCIGALIPIVFFMRKNSSPLRLGKVKMELRPILLACANGSSEMVSSVTSSIIGVLHNFQLLKYAGTNGVAAYAVLMYMQFIFAAIFMGYNLGSAPIISYHYGAENKAELQNLFKKSQVLMFGIGGGMAVCSFLFAKPFAGFFVGYDKELLAMTVRALCLYAGAFLFVGFNMFTSSMFTALNDGGVSAAMSFIRTFIFKSGAVLILPLLLKLDGVWWANVVSEIFAALISVIFLIGKRKKYQYW